MFFFQKWNVCKRLILTTHEFYTPAIRLHLGQQQGGHLCLGRPQEAMFVMGSSRRRRISVILGSSRRTISLWAAAGGPSLSWAAGGGGGSASSWAAAGGQFRLGRPWKENQLGPQQQELHLGQHSFILGDRRRRASFIFGNSSRNYILGDRRRRGPASSLATAAGTTSWATGEGEGQLHLWQQQQELHLGPRQQQLHHQRSVNCCTVDEYVQINAILNCKKIV